MELTNELRVDADPATTWAVLTDLERIAPCMPGAELQEVDGDEHRGVVKVKVGPIVARYQGTARFVDRDDVARRAVVQADGREARGQGNASATITAQLAADGDGTRVTVLTDLRITGKVAQFGRGVLADVSTKLIAQFAANLQQLIREDDVPEPGAAPGSSQPIDLLDSAVAPVTKRVVPTAAAAVVGLWLFWRWRRVRG